MKILFFITGLGMGGAERQVCELADQFYIAGHTVLIISMSGDTVTQPKSAGVRIVSLRMKKGLLNFFSNFRMARTIVRDFNPDVVHSHMVHANLFARLLRLTVSMRKLICTAHNTNEGGLIRMLSYRITDSLCDISTNVSQEAVDAFVLHKAVPANRMLPMHNGIDTDRFLFDSSMRKDLRKKLNLTDCDSLILAVGRLNVQKDYPNLLTAFSYIVSANTEIQLAVIGIGEEESVLTSMVDELGLNKHVHFLGLQHNVNEWLSAADVFVLSSAWEGFGLVVAEAMACKRVVVATDCGGVKEVLGDCGFLVPPQNSQALADGLSAALSLTSDEARVKGELARQRVIERYSLQEQAKRWLELYQR
nr:glycosyltransferase [Plesiomonas shigelloides]